MNKLISNRYLCKIINEYLSTELPYLDELFESTLSIRNCCSYYQYYSKSRVIDNIKTDIISVKYNSKKSYYYWSITSKLR